MFNIGYALNKDIHVGMVAALLEQGFSFKNGITVNPEIGGCEFSRLQTVPVFEKMPKYKTVDRSVQFEHLIRNQQHQNQNQDSFEEKFVTALASPDASLL